MWTKENLEEKQSLWLSHFYDFIFWKLKNKKVWVGGQKVGLVGLPETTIYFFALCLVGRLPNFLLEQKGAMSLCID